MLFLTITNEYILLAHKKGFLIAFSGVFFVIIFEIMSIFLNGSASEFKVVHFLSNYFGFILSPILITMFASSIGRFHRVKYALSATAAYFVLYNALIITGGVFFIDSHNVYHRGKFFFVYLFAYFLSILYLLYETLRYSRKGFIQHKIFVYILSVCFFMSCSIQVLNPDVYMARITVLFTLCIYYAYNIELTNLFDKLTGVLNQGTYLRKINELKLNQYVVILDIDNFKSINDIHGHQMGDKCLFDTSKIMKLIFSNYGQCYRIGGDEFAILLRKNCNVESLIARFEKAVAAKFENAPYEFNVSVGYSKYEQGDTVEDVVSRADALMYAAKKQNKARISQ